MDMRDWGLDHWREMKEGETSEVGGGFAQGARGAYFATFYADG